jgi:CBS-domain-containing membrane protein
MPTLPPVQVGNLSASDLRSLHTPEAFASLLGSADFFCAAPASRQLGAVGADATLGELLDLLAQHSWHRAYVVNGEGRPASIVTLTDILRRVAA